MQNSLTFASLFILSLSACNSSGIKTKNTEIPKGIKDTLAVTIGGKPHPKSLTGVEKTISGYLEKIERWRGSDYKDTTVSPTDSIAAINDSLEIYLTKICHDEPATLTSSLDSSGLGILTSADGNLRLYCWDTWMGGTMHFYNNYAQFLDGNKLYFVSMKDTSIEDDYGCDYTSLTQVHTGNNKTVYIVIGHLPVSTKDRYVTIDAWTIEQGALKPYAIFQTKTKELAHIDYGFDMFRWNSDKDIPDAHFSSDKMLLYIPIVDGESITGSNLVYKFNGDKFVFDKNAK